VRKLCSDRRDQEDRERIRGLEVRDESNVKVPADTATREDDTKWPQRNKDGRQELEIRMGNEHVSFEVQ
jgi:hypothetical protein